MKSPTTLGVTLSLTIAMAGCSTASNRPDAFASATERSALQTASSGQTLPVTFTDRKSLQYDTGQMDADVSESFMATHSGLRYRILRKSDGRKPTAADTVTVHYRGWLDNGQEFDNSYDRGEPTSFPLSGVVAGWTEGMQLIGSGGMIELWVPGRLGYGIQGKGNIPPNATLHFVVELLKVH